MKQLSKNQIKTFNLLNIGQRGVGKTVFLAGSYAELHSTHQNTHQKRLWFDCQDSQEREKIEKIFSYIAQNGQYPPPTLKITNFNFSLKRQSWRGVQTLCHFRWWDLPGECCNINNPDFQRLVLTSHGCCVFVNAAALVHTPTYQKVFENTLDQVAKIASIVEQHNLKYPLALIFTKCDLLIGATMSGSLESEEKAQPLFARLEAVKAQYKNFYSAIPIVYHSGSAKLKAKGAATSLLWLVSELRELDREQPQQELGTRLMQSSSESLKTVSGLENLYSLRLLPSTWKSIFLSLIILSILSIDLIEIAVLLFTLYPLTPAAKPLQNPEQRLTTEYEQR